VLVCAKTKASDSKFFKFTSHNPYMILFNKNIMFGMTCVCISRLLKHGVVLLLGT
jgi:hypothetical protein